jgi:hypothetical protein
MPLIQSLLGKLFGSSSRLSNLEKLILDCVRARLDAGAANLWDKQVQAVNKVQRLPEGVEVDFYRMKGGRPSFDPELAFANKTEELLVAKVRIGVSNSPVKLAASVWCVKGFLFSIEYEGSVKYFEEAAGMDPRPELVINCELTTDPSAAA